MRRLFWRNKVNCHLSAVKYLMKGIQCQKKDSLKKWLSEFSLQNQFQTDISLSIEKKGHGRNREDNLDNFGSTIGNSVHRE